MIIPKEGLNAEDVRRIVEQTLQEHLKLPIEGYKCACRSVIQILVSAALEGQRIESICEDLKLDVSSNTVREQWNAVLDVGELRRHECEMNAGLVACIPERLPRRGREMALDFHDEPFYGKNPELRTYTCRGEASDGTTHFYRIASLYGLWRQVRVTLAMTDVLPEDSHLSVVQRLLSRMQHLGFKPGVVYMDKGFCEGPIIRYLKAQNIPAIIACPIRGERGGTRALCRGGKAYTTSYTFSDGTTATLALRPSRVPDETGKRRLKWLAFVVIHLDWAAHKVYQRYRRRFGSESSYRQFGQLRARTPSRNPALRFLLLGLALLLLHIWAMLRFLATRILERGPIRLAEDLFRLQRFIACLRRAIESAFGTTDTIPIYAH